MIQLITNNPKRKDYPMIIVLLYFFGILAFLYTSCGSFGTYLIIEPLLIDYLQKLTLSQLAIIFKEELRIHGKLQF
jgi:hypothetical protein